MSEEAYTPTLRDRIRSWVFDQCFAYCIHSIHPDADPAEFRFLDTASFVAISKDELREVMEESPDSAWRFEAQL